MVCVLFPVLIILPVSLLGILFVCLVGVCPSLVPLDNMCSMAPPAHPAPALLVTSSLLPALVLSQAILLFVRPALVPLDNMCLLLVVERKLLILLVVLTVLQ
jgi:hypothetical protein